MSWTFSLGGGQEMPT